MPQYLVFFEAPGDGWHVERESLLAGLAAAWPGATFAAWFRGLVRGNTKVTFCDDMYTFEFDAPFGASAEDVARRCSEL